jgi:hypothetical protein
VLEYSAMALGVKAMYLVAAMLYAGATVAALREERALSFALRRRVVAPVTSM